LRRLEFPDGKHQSSEAGLKMMSRSAVRQNALRFLLFAIVAVGVGIPLGWLAGVRRSRSDWFLAMSYLAKSHLEMSCLEMSCSHRAARWFGFKREEAPT
jgi:hypothetical protein